MSTYPRPSVELALRKANGDRVAARKLIRVAIIQAAEADALLSGRSIKCQRREHASERYGCTNDGSGCICGCHDAATPYTEQETTK